MANAPAFAFLDEQHCEVAFGVGNCFQATDGNWYARSALVTAIAPANAPGLDLNPVSLVQSALHDLTGPVSTVEQWVLKQLVKLGALVSTDLEKAKGYTVQLIDGVGARIDHLAGQVNSVIGGIPHDITAALDELRHDVAADVDAVVKQASRGQGDIDAGLESIVHDSERYTNSVVAEMKRDVIDPLEKDLRRAIHDAESAADHAWHVWYKDIWAPAEHELAEARHDAAEAITFIDHSALDAIHLIDECWDWLERLAHNPLKSLEALPGELRTALPKAWTEAAVEPDTAVIDKVVSWLEEELPNV